jgi:hypothetical protein
MCFRIGIQSPRFSSVSVCLRKKLLFFSFLVLILSITSADAQNIILYEHDNYNGRSLTISENWDATSYPAFNDKISSIAIPEGIKIIIFEHSDFKGDFLEINENWSVVNGQQSWNDKISSIIVLDYRKKTPVYPYQHGHRASCIHLENHDCQSTALLPEQGVFYGEGYYINLDAAVKNPNDVRVLDIRGQNLSEWPSFFNELKNLEELYISHNNFNTWPGFFNDLKKLKILVADHNQFSTWPSYIHDLDHLEVINLSHNPLTTFPSFFSDLDNLRELDVSHTYIYTFPGFFNKLKKLQHLNISHTKISSFPSFFYELQALHYLDIRETAITSIPVKIKEMNMILLF